MEELKYMNVDDCIIENSKNKTSVFEIRNALKNNNYVAYFENGSKFKVLSSDKTLKVFKDEIP